jgi:hypothetical protein
MKVIFTAYGAGAEEGSAVGLALAEGVVVMVCPAEADALGAADFVVAGEKEEEEEAPTDSEGEDEAELDREGIELIVGVGGMGVAE